MQTITYDIPASWQCDAPDDLTERYRPKTLDEIVGQSRAVAEIRAWLANPSRRRALWLEGDTGIGKTTAARIVAREFADDLAITEYDSADDVTAGELDRIKDSMCLRAMGKGGRVWIINEAHGVSGRVLRGLLGVLERIPRHCLFIFTTTRAGAQMLLDGTSDASPLIDRCEVIRFTTQGFAKPAAQRLRAIAQAENADGEPESFYLGILRENGNSLRRAIGAVEKMVNARRADRMVANG